MLVWGGVNQEEQGTFELTAHCESLAGRKASTEKRGWGGSIRDARGQA
jgi:hypothetical protein